jgi:UDP-N-acetyl-D-mannosaminuronate dehydrogenase
MNRPQNVIVVGLGEIGRPILELASRCHQTMGVDVSPLTEKSDSVDILHICYPFAIADFIGETARYIELFKPGITIINSTVSVGTTRAVAERTGATIVNSPVRGKHARMTDDLLYYTKFVGAMDAAAAARAADHFQSLGMKTQVLSSPEATELAKLTETTYFGLVIAWAQEVERYCDRFDQNYDEVVSFYEQIKYLPGVKFFPGVIGGHCVMPNIEILKRLFSSEILHAIESSNKTKIEREGCKGKAANSLAEQTVVGKAVGLP